jgi:hypothetical protein
LISKGVIIISPVGSEKSSCHSTVVFPARWETVFIPRTELVKRLYVLRAKAVISGMKLLSEEQVLEEVKRRRGETEENEKDLP